MDEPAGDHLSMAETALGEPDETFRISRARVRAKFWTGIALIFGSIAVTAGMFALGLGLDAALLVKIILTPLIIGLMILITMYRQRGLMVLVYPAGLLRLQRGEAVSFPWDEIAEVRLKIQRLDEPDIIYDEEGEPKQCWLASEAPSMMVWQASMVLERADGAEAHVSPAIADYDRLVKLVQRRTFRRLWVEARDRLLNGESIAFGDLIVTGAGLKHTTKKLAWKDFKELVIAQGRLTVKKASGWMPWVVMDVSKVPNPHVLFALVTVARDAAKAPVPKTETEEGDPS